MEDEDEEDEEEAHEVGNGDEDEEVAKDDGEWHPVVICRNEEHKCLLRADSVYHVDAIKIADSNS